MWNTVIAKRRNIRGQASYHIRLFLEKRKTALSCVLCSDVTELTFGVRFTDSKTLQNVNDWSHVALVDPLQKAFPLVRKLCVLE